MSGTAIVTSRAGGQLWDSVGRIPQEDHALEYIVEGFGRMWTVLYDLVRDAESGEPGWSIVLDADRCPVWALPWLAQFNGVRIQPGQTEAEQRAHVAWAGYRRASVQAMIEVARPTLTGTRTVRIFERTGGSAWRISAVTLESETPDPARTERALRSQKAIGLVLDFRTELGWTYSELTAAYAGGTYTDLGEDYASYHDLQNVIPRSS